jgi:CBS-domain-containing membrane protein
LLRRVHPPAGITPLVLYGSAYDWTFLLVPVLAGAVSVAILARTAQKLIDLAEAVQADKTVPAFGGGKTD